MPTLNKPEKCACGEPAAEWATVNFGPMDRRTYGMCVKHYEEVCAALRSKTWNKHGRGICASRVTWEYKKQEKDNEG